MGLEITFFNRLDTKKPLYHVIFLIFKYKWNILKKDMRLSKKKKQIIQEKFIKRENKFEIDINVCYDISFVLKCTF